MKILLKNAKILTKYNAEIFYGHIIVEDEKIISIQKGEVNFVENFDKVIDCKNNLLMPGLIDCHTHSPMTILKGVGEGCELEEWLFDKVIPFENKFDKKAVYYATKLAILEYVKNGITTVNEMYVHHASEIIKAFNESGIRAFLCIEAKDEKEEEKLINECLNTNGMVSPSICCHSVYKCGEPQFARKIKLSKKYNLVVSTHASETLTEVGNCVKENNLTPIALLESYGFLDRPCIIYHGVHLDKEDFDILKKYDVSVCTNPSSNLKLGSGICAVSTLLSKGINVCLGTDGSSSNNRLDMFREMYLASCLQKANMGNASVVNAEETLKIATVNGAKAVNNNKIGSLKEGNFADLIMINLNGVDNATNINIKSNLVYASGVEDVMLTMCNGKILYENGQFNIGINPEEVYSECNKIISKLKIK